MIKKVPRQHDQVSPLFYVPKDFKTGLTITLKLWNFRLEYVGTKTTMELEDGLYYFTISDINGVGGYIGLITEQRLVHNKRYPIILDITL